MAFTGVVAASWKLYRSLFGRLVLLFAALQVLTVFLGEALRAIAEDRPVGLVAVLGLFFVLVGVLLGSAQVVATCSAVVGHLNGRAVSGIEALVGLPKKKELLSAGLFLGMLAMVTASLLGQSPLSGSILWVLYGPLIVGHVIVVERVSLQEAWSRTKELSNRHVARIFLYLFCIALLIVLFEGLLGNLVLFGLFDASAKGIGVRATGDALTVLLNTLFLPYLAIAATVIYLELRARKEGLTLEGLQNEWAATDVEGAANRD